MEKVYQKGLAADGAEDGYPGAERPLPGGMGGKDAMEEIAAEIEEKPRQHGEVVAGAKARVGKAQRRQQPGGVEALRKLHRKKLTQTQVSAVHFEEKQEKEKTEAEAQPGFQPFQQGVEGDEQQHGAADEIQHPEPNGLRGQGDESHRRYHQAPEIYDYAPAEILLLPPAPDKARDEDEAPADALLPYVDGGYAVPVRIYSIDHFHVVHEMIGHHTQHREAAEGVDAVEAGRFVFHSLLLIWYAYILRQRRKKAREKAAA